MEEIIRKRGSLERFKEAIKNKKARVGFIGGSITDAKNGNNWPYRVMGYLIENFKDVKFTCDNVAVGATGSLNGLTRVDEDLISRNVDVVFFEYAVNDKGVEPEKRMKSREGILRRLLKKNIDVVIVYTYCKEMYDDMDKGGVPDTIKELEDLANHYNIPSVWMALKAFRMVEAGMMSWQQWLPDGLHPQEFGGYIYATAVWEYLKDELNTENKERILMGDKIPAPFDKGCYEDIEQLDMEKSVELSGPWYKLRETSIFWHQYMYYTTSIRSTLKATFKGRGLVIFLDYGNLTPRINYRIDGGEEQFFEGIHDDWVKNSGWPLALPMADDLEPDKEHTFEITLAKSKDSKAPGTECKINGFTVIK